MMPDIDKRLRPLIPAIKQILDDYPDELAAAPKLRALAIKHKARRYQVFGAYRLLAQQRSADSE